MDLNEMMERARRSQQENEQRHDVQLELPIHRDKDDESTDNERLECSPD